jgi:hypothetical protein
LPETGRNVGFILLVNKAHSGLEYIRRGECRRRRRRRRRRGRRRRRRKGSNKVR